MNYFLSLIFNKQKKLFRRDKSVAQHGSGKSYISSFEA